MKILYDHQMFSFQRFGGITRYFCDLIANLPDDYEFILPIRYSENNHLQKIGINHDSIFPQLPFRIKRQYYYRANNCLSKKAISQHDFDVFHPTYYDNYFLKRLRKPFVLTVHDLTHEKFNSSFLFYDRTAAQKIQLLQQAAHIIAVSHNTKNDIVDLCNIAPDKVSVVHHGYQQIQTPAPQLFSNYILYVGERRGYKNFLPFLRAISPLLRAKPELKLVCTGRPFDKQEAAAFAGMRVERQIVQIFASDAELASLYRHARLFAYPSLYEGFGIPILESFHNNCPVALSRASCFPEIAAEAALYFDPLEADSICECIGKILDNDSLANELRSKGQERLKLFSINKMVRETCRVYDIISSTGVLDA
ncbi:MAG: glycosyltransferase family 4 protein [Tannerellaceae bacterium]|nr:glycosyltransferase family 4 protein [Tannerellaceae bacterium]